MFIGMEKEDLNRKVPYETIGTMQIMKEIWYGAEHYPTMLSIAAVKGVSKM